MKEKDRKSTKTLHTSQSTKKENFQVENKKENGVTQNLRKGSNKEKITLYKIRFFWVPNFQNFLRQKFKKRLAK